jgi:AraC-like DNA-binding protein
MIKDFQKFDLFDKKVFEKAIVKPPFRLIAKMANEACFFYTVVGKTSNFSATERIDCETNEGVVMKCGNYLSQFLKTSEADYCEAIAIHFYPDVLKLLFDKDFPDFLRSIGQVKQVTYGKVKTTKVLATYIESLQFYFENPALVSEALLSLKLKEIILILAKTDNAEAIYALLSGLFSETDINFKEIIEANIFNDLSMAELAALTNMSLSSFKREFAKHFDQSPARYIKSQRLEKAASLLSLTDLRISDIAFDCGFNDLAHFSKAFQKFYGYSPSEFKLNQLNKSMT